MRFMHHESCIWHASFTLASLHPCTYSEIHPLHSHFLRDLEVEMIRERLSSTVMESLLALTIFREEFGFFFVSMFATLVFIKVGHWLVQDRVDYVEVTPSVSRLQHVRLVAFMSALLVRTLTHSYLCPMCHDSMTMCSCGPWAMCRVHGHGILYGDGEGCMGFGWILFTSINSVISTLNAYCLPVQAIDLVFLQHTIHGTIQSSGQSVMLLFAFEYVIQASSVIKVGKRTPLVNMWSDV